MLNVCWLTCFSDIRLVLETIVGPSYTAQVISTKHKISLLAFLSCHHSILSLNNLEIIAKKKKEKMLLSIIISFYKDLFKSFTYQEVTIHSMLDQSDTIINIIFFDHTICISFLLCVSNTLPDMPVSGSSSSAANKDMMVKIWTNGSRYHYLLE